MKARRPRTTGKSSGTRRDFSKPSPRSYRKKEDGDSSSSSDRGAGRPYKKSYSKGSDAGKRPDRLPAGRHGGGYRKDSAGGSTERKRYSSSDNRGERKSFVRGGYRKGPDGESTERKRYSSSDSRGERKSFDRGGYRKGPDGENTERKRYSSSDSRGERKSFDRGGYRKGPDGENTERKRYSSSDSRGERKSFDKKPGRTFGRKSFDDKNKPGRFDKEKKSYGRPGERTERRSFDKKDSSERVSRDKFDGEKRSEGFSSERRSYSSDKPRYFDRPKRDFKSSGSGLEKRSEGFQKKPSGSDERGFPERKWNRKEDHRFYGEKKKFSKKRSEEDSEPDGSTRLNKYIANAGICSRREADDLIKAGVVSVNGEVITEMGYKVKQGDEVRYNNELLRSEKMVYLLLNKPKDFITTAKDPEERKTVMNLIRDACSERVYPVGRLDRNTTGLLLFTNDGELTKRLTHPGFEVQKIYQVDLDKNLKESDMDKLNQGLELEDGFIKPDAISYVGAGSDKSVVGIELHSGRNRVVRRMFEALGYEVKKLDRVYFAGLSKKDLPRGRWRFLTQLEVSSLKMMTGDKQFKSIPPEKSFATD